MSHVIDGARDLMTMVDSVKGHFAGTKDPQVAELLADALWPIKETDDADEQAAETAKRDRVLEKLHDVAAHRDDNLGAMRYVLATAYVGTKETHDSIWTWSVTRRDRITKALVHMARFVAKQRAGFVAEPAGDKAVA